MTDDRAWTALSPGEATVLCAAVARIIPSDDLGPGAAEADAAVYIDRALGGPLDEELELFEEGLTALDAAARARHGTPFAGLRGPEQDALLAAAERDHARFFTALVRRTREGMFCDPAYGGNRDRTGWALLGIPGFQEEYRAEEEVLGATPRTRLPLALADLNFTPPPGGDHGDGHHQEVRS